MRRSPRFSISARQTAGLAFAMTLLALAVCPSHASSAENDGTHNMDLIDVTLGSEGTDLGTWLFIPGFGDRGNGLMAQRLIRGLRSNLEAKKGTLRFVGASDRHSDYDKYVEDNSHSMAEEILTSLSEKERRELVLLGHSMGATRALQLASKGNLVIALSPTDIPKLVKKVPVLILKGTLDDMLPIDKFPPEATIHDVESVAHGLQYFMGSAYDDAKTRTSDKQIAKVMLDFVRARKKRR